ncbi:MAG: hypothetical protein JWR26_1783 [Pedosphaera sp.]|nr:hypothetical protein [Pedosphaera sp.]
MRPAVHRQPTAVLTSLLARSRHFVGVQPLPGMNSRLPGSEQQQPPATKASDNTKRIQIFDMWAF